MAIKPMEGMSQNEIFLALLAAVEAGHAVASYLPSYHDASDPTHPLQSVPRDQIVNLGFAAALAAGVCWIDGSLKPLLATGISIIAVVFVYELVIRADA